MKSSRLEAGSFRDREARVYYRGDRVYRALSPTAAQAWRRLSDTDFFGRWAEEGRIVATRQVEAAAAGLDELSGEWVLALEHGRIPFVSYPYEWSFGMLRDAALLQLDLLLAALGEELILKDASAYNIQWNGARPVFIDLASFEERAEGDPWAGYLQFCQLFLYPLMLTAYRGLPFHPWLRGTLDGLSPEDCNRLLSFRDLFRAGVFTNVFLQSKLQARNADSDAEVRGNLQRAGFKKEMIVANVKRLRKIVTKLEWRSRGTEWSSYETENSYDRESGEAKKTFVADVVALERWKLVWDLGSNTGAFSRIAAANADYVVAFDADHATVDRMYLSTRDEGPTNILPLVNNVADPSPALGWQHRERRIPLERGQPDLVLCLALIHHLVIGANIPLPELVAWLASLGSSLVIEFVTKDDAMVKRLLRNKTDNYDDYEVEVFERCLEGAFRVERRQTVHEGTRVLYFARPLS